MSTAQILLLVIKATIPFALWVVSLPGERSKLCQFAWWEVQAYVSLPGERSKPTYSLPLMLLGCQFAWWEVQAMSVCLVRSPSLCQFAWWEVQTYIQPTPHATGLSACLVRSPSLCQFAWWEVQAYVSLPGEKSKPMSVCLVRGPSLRVLAVQHMSLYSLKSQVYHNFFGYWQMNAFNILSCLHDYRWQIWQILSCLCLQ